MSNACDILAKVYLINEVLSSILILWCTFIEDGIKPMFAMVTFEPQEDTTQDLYLEIVNDTIGKPPEYLRLVVQDENRQQEPVAINITIGDDDQGTSVYYDVLTTYHCV